jgi:hypothetical protein
MSKITSQDPQGQAEPSAPDYGPGTPVFDPDGKETFVERVYVRQGGPWLQLTNGFGCWADAVRPRTIPEKQSALPWSTKQEPGKRWWNIKSGAGLRVGTLYLEETARLDADLIVRAVNALGPLQGALLKVQAILGELDELCTPEDDSRAIGDLMAILDDEEVGHILQAARAQEEGA